MTEADYILIGKKLDGDLTAEEARAFDQRYAQDPAFADEYQLQQQLVDTFRAHHPRRLKKEVKALYEEVKAEHRVRTRRRGLAWAAAVALLMVAAAAFFYLRPPSAAALYAEYYHPYRARVTPRGEASSSTEQAEQATDRYSQRQFGAAIPLLKVLSQDGGAQADRWRLILGNAYLQSDSVAQAIEQFEHLTATTPHPEYYQHAQWYAALGYLRRGNVPAATQLLQAIAHHPGLFQSKARQLLDDL